MGRRRKGLGDLAPIFIADNILLRYGLEWNRKRVSLLSLFGIFVK